MQIRGTDHFCFRVKNLLGLSIQLSLATDDLSLQTVAPEVDFVKSRNVAGTGFTPSLLNC